MQSCDTLPIVRDPRAIHARLSIMGNYTKAGRPKAKVIKSFYRDPKFKGGKCCVCRTRTRNYLHAEYPHMCDKCRDSRVARHDAPVMAPGAMSRQMQYDQSVLERYLAERQPFGNVSHGKAPDQKSVQSLNAPLSTPQQRIAESAARFRQTVKK